MNRRRCIPIATTRPCGLGRRNPRPAAGFTLLNVRSSGPDYDLGPLRDWLAWRDDVNARDS